MEKCNTCGKELSNRKFILENVTYLGVEIKGADFCSSICLSEYIESNFKE